MDSIVNIIVGLVVVGIIIGIIVKFFNSIELNRKVKEMYTCPKCGGDLKSQVGPKSVVDDEWQIIFRCTKKGCLYKRVADYPKPPKGSDWG